MPDLQGVLPHDNALDQQVQEGLLVGKGRIHQTGPYAVAERREVGRDSVGVCALPAQALLLQTLLLQRPAPLRDAPPTLRQLRQRDDLRLVGVQQPAILALEPRHPHP